MSPQAEIVAQFWGAEAPVWIEALAQACAQSSQNAVAQKLGYTPGVVSAVLRRKYQGDMQAVEERIRGALMNATLDCPARGALRLNECRDWRARTRQFLATNPERVRMYRACMRCPRHTEKDDA